MNPAVWVYLFGGLCWFALSLTNFFRMWHRGDIEISSSHPDSPEAKQHLRETLYPMFVGLVAGAAVWPLMLLMLIPKIRAHLVEYFGERITLGSRQTLFEQLPPEEFMSQFVEAVPIILGALQNTESEEELDPLVVSAVHLQIAWGLIFREFEDQEFSPAAAGKYLVQMADRIRKQPPALLQQDLFNEES